MTDGRPVPGTPIPAALVTWCDSVARAAALLLFCCEERYPDGRVRLSNSVVEGLLDAGAQALKTGAFPTPSHRPTVQGRVLRLPLPCEPRGGLRAVERRLARLVLSKWAGTVRTGGLDRPDVLALTTRMLTNPDSAYTYHIARFSLLAALRSLYGVTHDQASLARLREAYNNLRGHADVSAGEGAADACHEALILDVLHVEGWVPRHLPHGEREYYKRFGRHTLGVPRDRKMVRHPDRPADLPDRLPDFGTLQGLLFAHPTGVAGLDFITGGLLPALRDPESELAGGLATLISGPAGTGKTSLCLTLGTRMSELGSDVAYVTTEESPSALESKRKSLVDPLSVSLAMPLSCVGSLAAPSFRIIDGSGIESLRHFSDILRARAHATVFGAEGLQAEEEDADFPTLEFSLVFPRVVIIDSVTALLQLSDDQTDGRGQPAAGPPAEGAAAEGTLPAAQAQSAGPPTKIELRRELAQTLKELRESGVCVILVGGEEDRRDEALAYLVDNVFALGVDAGEDRSHPLLTLSLEKMRFQNTQRERHVFHLAGPGGPTVSPSLHAVLRRLDRLPHPRVDTSVRAFVWESDDPVAHAREPRRHLAIHGRAQTLIYGFGASGKSRFAMSLAMEPRVPMMPKDDDYRAYIEQRVQGPEKLTDTDRQRMSEARVLVVSFQYGAPYYHDIAREVLKQRFRCTSDRPERHVDVVDFYPGAVDAESVVRRVRMRLRHGEVSGTPHTAVVLDGVHNIVAQFPALAREALLWPTLYQLFRTYGIDAITTFTFFRIPSPNRSAGAKGDPTGLSLTDAFNGVQPGRRMRDVEHQYFQILVTNCDYTFEIEPPLTSTRPELRNVVRIQLSSSFERDVEAPLRVIWNADTFSRLHETEPAVKPERPS